MLVILVEEGSMIRKLCVFAIFCLFIPYVSAADLAVTVYNQNRGVIKDTRDLTLKQGISSIAITDVASEIDPTSVHFKSKTSPDKLQILEQNYEYDLVNSNKILEKYLDETIQVVTEKDVYSGKLLSASGGDVVIQTSNGIQVIKSSAIQRFDFPELPDGLITRPTLVWQVKNSGPEKQKGEISYLTGGLNWHAEYVAVVDQHDENLELNGWVSIDNRSGAAYPDAKLKLIAGDVNVVQPRSGGRMQKGLMLDMAMSEAEPQFEEKSFFEYHMYTLQRPATLKNNQTKQISLFPSSSTKTDKLYLYDGARYQNKVRVNVEFKNSKDAGLGMPLPKGTVRVYKSDSDGSLEFIGEDQIDHTPKDEKVRIFLGNAFDLTGERNQKSVRKVSDRAREESYEIKLRNHKQEAVSITIIEHLWGDWTITAHSHDYTKKNAQTLEFQVSVPKDGEVVVTYTSLFKY